MRLLCSKLNRLNADDEMRRVTMTPRRTVRGIYLLAILKVFKVEVIEKGGFLFVRRILITVSQLVIN